MASESFILPKTWMGMQPARMRSLPLVLSTPHHTTLTSQFARISNIDKRLQERLYKLQNNKLLESIKEEVLALAQDFSRDTFPGITHLVNSAGTKEVSTGRHNDFSPRNIFVFPSPYSHSKTNFPLAPVHPAGLLDFEFSGFFPFRTEFLSNVINHSEDLPEHA